MRLFMLVLLIASMHESDGAAEEELLVPQLREGLASGTCTTILANSEALGVTKKCKASSQWAPPAGHALKCDPGTSPKGYVYKSTGSPATEHYYVKSGSAGVCVTVQTEQCKCVPGSGTTPIKPFCLETKTLHNSEGRFSGFKSVSTGGAFKTQFKSWAHTKTLASALQGPVAGLIKCRYTKFLTLRAAEANKIRASIAASEEKSLIGEKLTGSRRRRRRRTTRAPTKSPTKAPSPGFTTSCRIPYASRFSKTAGDCTQTTTSGRRRRKKKAQCQEIAYYRSEYDTNWDTKDWADCSNKNPLVDRWWAEGFSFSQEGLQSDEDAKSVHVPRKLNPRKVLIQTLEERKEIQTKIQTAMNAAFPQCAGIKVVVQKTAKLPLKPLVYPTVTISVPKKSTSQPHCPSAAKAPNLTFNGMGVVFGVPSGGKRQLGCVAASSLRGRRLLGGINGGYISSKPDGHYACDVAYLLALSLMKGKKPQCINQKVASRGKTCEPMAIFTLQDLTAVSYRTGCKNVASVCSKVETVVRKVMSDYRFEQVQLKLQADNTRI